MSCACGAIITYWPSRLDLSISYSCLSPPISWEPIRGSVDSQCIGMVLTCPLSPNIMKKHSELLNALQFFSRQAYISQMVQVYMHDTAHIPLSSAFDLQNLCRAFLAQIKLYSISVQWCSLQRPVSEILRNRVFALCFIVIFKLPTRPSHMSVSVVNL